MADFNNPENHGDFLIALSVNEKVNNGKKQVTSVVVCKPNTHPLEVPYLKAISLDNSIQITSVAHPRQFVKEQKQWIKVLDDNKKFLQSDVLCTTLNSLCTKLTPKDNDGNPLPPTLKTTTITGFDKLGISFADDYFTTKMDPDDDDGELFLDPLPLPYKYTEKVADETFTYSE